MNNRIGVCETGDRKDKTSFLCVVRCQRSHPRRSNPVSQRPDIAPGRHTSCWGRTVILPDNFVVSEHSKVVPVCIDFVFWASASRQTFSSSVMHTFRRVLHIRPVAGNRVVRGLRTQTEVRKRQVLRLIPQRMGACSFASGYSSVPHS